MFCGTDLNSHFLTHSLLEDNKFKFYIATCGKTTCTAISSLTQLFRVLTRNSCCYSKLGFRQFPTQVAKNISQLFQVSTWNSCRYSKQDMGQCPTRVITLQNLNAAHQGTTGMSVRANKTVCWPGMNDCIRNHRAQCVACNQVAPNHLAEPHTCSRMALPTTLH